MIEAVAVYLTIAAFVFVVVSFADETTEGEKITWTQRATTAIAWPVFVILAIADFFNGEFK